MSNDALKMCEFARCRSELLAADASVKPRFGERPGPFGSAEREVQRHRGFLLSQAREEPQLDEPGSERIVTCEVGERLIEREQVFGPVRRRDQSGIQIDDTSDFASTSGFNARRLDEDATHRL